MGKKLFVLVFIMFDLILLFKPFNTFAADRVIKNDTFWKDSSGNPIYSQGGGILKVNDTYYWYGVKYNGAISYVKNPTKKNNNSSFNAITCYSSKDLVNWKFENNILSSDDGTDNDFCHVSQTGFFVNVNGSKGTTVLFCGDRWSDFAGNGIGYNQWCPLSFRGDTPYFNSVSEFNLDASKGTWSVGKNNNYVLNPGFEADRVTLNDLAGWNTWDNLSNAIPNSNINKAYQGNFCVQQSYTEDYKSSRYQNITGLPDGTYTLKAYVKSSGGQNVCQIFAKNFGGDEKDYSINNNINSWKEVTIPDIKVTNGKCQIGIYSDAKANNWCKVDNFSLTKN